MKNFQNSILKILSEHRTEYLLTLGFQMQVSVFFFLYSNTRQLLPCPPKESLPALLEIIEPFLRKCFQFWKPLQISVEHRFVKHAVYKLQTSYLANEQYLQFHIVTQIKRSYGRSYKHLYIYYIYFMWRYGRIEILHVLNVLFCIYLIFCLDLET